MRMRSVQTNTSIARSPCSTHITPYVMKRKNEFPEIIWMSGALHAILSSSPSRTEPLRLVADAFYRLVQRIHFTHVMHML